MESVTQLSLVDKVIRRLAACATTLAVLLAAPFAATPANAAQSKLIDQLGALLAPFGYRGVELNWDKDSIGIRGKINGQTERMTVDTGAFMTCVDDALDKKLAKFEAAKDRLSENTAEAFARLSPEHPQKLRIIDRLELGSTAFLNEPAQILHFGSDIARHHRVLLGADWLRRHHALVFVWGKPTLFVRQEALNPERGAALRNVLAGPGYAELPLVSRGNHWIVAAKINGEPVSLALDTAAHATVLSEPVFKKLGLKSRGGVGEMRGLEGKKTQLDAVRAREFEIAGQRLTGFTFGMADMKSWKITTATAGSFDGVLGVDALSRGHAIIDCGRNKLYLLTRLPEEKAKNNNSK